MLSDEQLQEWARQAVFSAMGDVREVLDRVVSETVEACAVMADEEAKKWWIRDEFSRFAAAIREKARTK